MLLTYTDECDMSMIVNDHKFAMELFYDSVSWYLWKVKEIVASKLGARKATTAE